MNKFFLGVAFVLSATCAQALSFLPGQMEKVNWESRQLTSIDVDGDGRTDLAYINGIERSIDLLMQKKEASLEPSKAKETAPPMAMTRYRRERISTEAAPSAFVFGDFSGKGKMELAYTAKRLGIVFMERNAEGRWVETHRISDVEVQPFTHVMWAGPLSKGAPTSLVVLVKGRVLIIRDYKIAQSYGTLYEDSGYVVVNDINGDGRMDISYDYETPNGLAYRLQDSSGRFDGERLLSYATESEKNFGNRADHFYFFGGNTSFVEERKISPTPLKPAAEIYGYLSDKAVGLLSDLEGKGEESLVLADSKGAELIIYRRKDGGWGSPERFPSLKGVTSMVGLGQKKGSPPVLALFSPDERSVGLTQWESSEKRVGFPRLLELNEEPVGLFGLENRAWVVVRGDKDYGLVEIFANGSVGERMKLDGMKRAPDMSLALKQKEGVLLAFFQNRDSAQFFWLPGKGMLTQVKVPASLMRSNFTNIDESRVGKGMLNDDKTQELIIAQRSNLRLYSFVDGQMTLSDQVLPLMSDANLRMPWVNKGVLWAYNAKGSVWLKFERAGHLWKNTGQMEVPGIDPEVVLANGDQVIGIGRRAFYTVNPAAQGIALAPVKRWESALKVDGYNWASLESFDAAKTPAAVLFSQNKRILEVVSLGEKPESLLNFEVYKKDVHFEGRKGEDVEPREIITADVTGDGKTDLILLIHNKVIVYPQG